MREIQRRNKRKKHKFSRVCKRVLRTILLMPGKIPPIDIKTIEVCMKLCETIGVVFSCFLIANLITENAFVSTCTYLTGFAFAGLVLFIKLADYQDRLVRERLADYVYIR